MKVYAAGTACLRAWRLRHGVPAFAGMTMKVCVAGMTE